MMPIPSPPSAPPPDWDGLARWLAQWYPEVPAISVADLDTWLRDARRAPPLLLDRREVDEQAVSTLPGAICVASDAAARRALAGGDRERPIVVYCAVGVRSAQLARALQRGGHTRVLNLAGSIFAWANAGLPLVSGGAPAFRVHPYDATWSALLAPERRGALRG